MSIPLGVCGCQPSSEVGYARSGGSTARRVGDARFDLRSPKGEDEVVTLFIPSPSISIRLDYSYDTFGPIRFNEAVAMLICVAGIGLLVWLNKYRPGRETQVQF